jgi:hypothetical protein
MAVLKANRHRILTQPKWPVYVALFNINAAFRTIAYEIERLDDYEAIPLETLRVYMAASEELRAAMNHRMLDVLQRREQRDWYHYGMSRREQEAILERS